MAWGRYLWKRLGASSYWAARGGRSAAMFRWRRQSEIVMARKRRRVRVRRAFLNEKFGYAVGPPVIASDMVPPFIITGTQGPFEVPGPLQVYTSSTYFEAPTVVNTQEAWNIIRSRTENFPLWWDRMR